MTNRTIYLLIFLHAALLFSSGMCPVCAKGNSYITDFWEQQFAEIDKNINEHKLGKTTSAPQDNIFDENALILPTDKDPADVMLRRTRLLLEDIKCKRRSGEMLELEHRLEKLINEGMTPNLAKTTTTDPQLRKDLFIQASELSREIALANPLMDFDTIVFIGYLHPTSGERHMVDQFLGWNAKVGGGLYMVRGLKSGTPVLIDVLKNSRVANGRFAGSNLSNGAFLSPDLHFDGKRIVFSWTNQQDLCYHIFSVNVDGTDLRQLTDGKTIKTSALNDENQNDLDPCWLPNGRIAFISDRRGGWGRCHTIPKQTYTLYSMKDDGSDVVCLSYHETNEWHPSVANDGKIVYTRWDYVDRDDCIAHHIWTCYPDGRDPRAPHGNYPLPLTTMTGSTWRDGRWDRPNGEWNIRAIPGSDKYTAIAAAHHGHLFGELIIIDPAIEDDGKVSQVQRVTTAWNNWPDFAEGPYGTPWPLSEDYYICNKNNSIILRDRWGNEQVLYTHTGSRPVDPIPVRPRTAPPVIATGTWQGERSGQEDHKRATISVMNVYESDIPLPPGVKIKSMRIVQVFPKETPVINNPRNAYASEALIRMPLGTVPVEEDGSVYCEAPVGKAIYFQLLDEKGLAVHSMRSATYAHNGEQLSCIGCHENKWKAPSPMPNRLAFKRLPSRLNPDAGGVEPANFHRLVKPVFDSKCVSCHTQRASGPNMSYSSLKNHAFYFCGDGNPYINGDIVTRIKGGSRTIPGSFGAAYSSLFKTLDRGHHEVSLSKDELKRITLWLDLNSMELGAETRVDAQRRGELVWPRLDVDIDNPTGVEKNRPLPGITDANLIYNNDFSTETNDWILNVWAGSASGIVNNGEYKITIGSIGTNNYDIQLVQPGILLENGKTYQVTFDAYAASSRSLEANVEMNDSPWTSYLKETQIFDLTTNNKTYTFYFKMDHPTDVNGRLSFNAGSSTNTVFIDNVILKSVNPSTPNQADRISPYKAVKIECRNSILKLRISDALNGATTITLYDLRGNVVKRHAFRFGSGETSENSLDLRGFTNGYYIIELKNSGTAIHRSKLLLYR